jgi:hypothetical protein
MFSDDLKAAEEEAGSLRDPGGTANALWLLP